MSATAAEGITESMMPLRIAAAINFLIAVHLFYRLGVPSPGWLPG
jgi:hypothetical protein